MSSDDIAIRVDNLSKLYHIYEKPVDRLKQFILPRLQRILGLNTKQYYKEFWALKNVSFDVKKGQTLGIIGRNGSGKSTLLQLVCGTLNPTSGSVHTNGRVAAILELGSGFNADFTGRENVYLNAGLFGLTTAEIDQRYQQILDFADIGDFINQPVKTYSSGMLVRLAFAVIAHVDADILVIDEALAVGDAFFTQKCMRFLRLFMKTGTVLFVSHDSGSINALCDSAIWLKHGVVNKFGSPKDITEIYHESIYESVQGKKAATKSLKLGMIESRKPLIDQRIKFINNSKLRNDIKIFLFNPDAPSFGIGEARITNVSFLDESFNPLSWVVGGEVVRLQVCVEVYKNMLSPIVGFFVKDRLGQTIFGDNTFLSYKELGFDCNEDDHLEANFLFSMPILPSGDYSVTVAFAEGTQENHVQHQWIHDAIIFRSESTSVATGLVGIPMLDVTLEKLERNR